MRRANPRVLLIALGLVVAMIVVNASLAFRETRQLHADALWVEHTYQVLGALEQLSSTIKDAETAQRGFLLTGDSRHLATYQRTVAAHEEQLERVAGLTTDNPAQSERLSRLRQLITNVFEEFAAINSVRAAQGLEAAQARMTASEGEQPLDAILAVVGEMQQEERGLLEQRQERNQQTYHWALTGGILAAGFGLLTVGGFYWLLLRHLAALASSATMIHQQRELLQATLISIGDGVIATDAGARVTFLNTVAQTLTGWTQAEASGQRLEHVFRIINEETRLAVENPAHRALREGKIVGLANHTILLAKDGAEWPIDDSAAPILSPDGKASGAILVFREIRERKRQEMELRRQAEALQEADHRKDEFLAMLAHELRNPLAPLSNGLQLWSLIENDPAEMERLREMMERQVRQMIHLIDDLMDVSRITRGKIQLRMQRVDLATLISGAVEAVQPFAESRGHQLTMTLPTDELLVEGDVARLMQVFGNILHNAAKYAQRDGVIWVSAQRSDTRAIVTIRDNGPGIPPHMLTQIFEMFRQVDQTLDRSQGGLGIGLTLVKRLVELHGGTVEARSEGPGKGSEFIVSLPALAPDPHAHVEGAPRDVLHHIAGLPCHRILVVDDLHASATTLAMMLRAIGQEVAVVHDGFAAIDWVLENRPDVVFLDIAMPGMNGYEVARKIREHADCRQIYLVALTGYGQDEDRKRAIAAGFDQHLTKPTSIDALQHLLLVRRASPKH